MATHDVEDDLLEGVELKLMNEIRPLYLPKAQ
jgi:hypothetical protein